MIQRSRLIRNIIRIITGSLPFHCCYPAKNAVEIRPHTHTHIQAVGDSKRRISCCVVVVGDKYIGASRSVVAR